jgi:selenocysteine-specific elongation factor
VFDQPLHAPTNRIDAHIRLLPSEDRLLRHLTSVHLHIGAAQVPARRAILDRERLAPGEEAFGQLLLERHLGALHGDWFVFRDSAARRTMGGGIVVDPGPPKRGRRRPERLVAIAALTEADPQQALLSHFSGDPGWVDLGSLCTRARPSREGRSGAVASNELSVCRSQRHFVRLWFAQMASAGTGDRGGLGGLS